MGTDADGEEIYAGRAPHEGDILPAKVIPSKNACYIAYDGEEILKDQFEVCFELILANQFSRLEKLPDTMLKLGFATLSFYQKQTTTSNINFQVFASQKKIQNTEVRHSNTG